MQSFRVYISKIAYVVLYSCNFISIISKSKVPLVQTLHKRMFQASKRTYFLQLSIDELKYPGNSNT